ncbi:hypothetical protein BGW38_005270 [Lunasporangiospora selenospora]|uniref:2-dehydropantoate 2-reductase n=1 Tax=Lunasporangiospora selenospora TaxID=979761 RepID=A0A9P6G1W0_9FUNG|nr:hypothetical protein BGW38_005270 [Lunasporangiospora selenospora]
MTLSAQKASRSKPLLGAKALMSSSPIKVRQLLCSFCSIERQIPGASVDNHHYSNAPFYPLHFPSFSLLMTHRRSMLYPVVKAVPKEEFDYILVCMKALPDVYSIADIIAPAVEASPDAAIVLIQNGIGIEDPIKARFPRNPILSSIAYIGVTQNELGVIYHSGKVQRLVTGLFEPIEGVDAEGALKVFGDRCNAGGIESAITDDIQNYRWRKLVWNGSMNPVCILSNLWTVSNVLASEKYRAMVETTMKEIVTLAEALGHEIPSTLVQQSMETSARLADGYKASMVVDLEEGRPLETEVILTNPIRIAEEKQLTHLIPTWYGQYKDLLLYLAERRKASDTRL